MRLAWLAGELVLGKYLPYYLIEYSGLIGQFLPVTNGLVCTLSATLISLSF